MNALTARNDPAIGLGVDKKGSVEQNALKNVIRANWENSLAGTEKLRNRQLMPQLESHADKMHEILNSYDYEIFCIPNIIAHSRHMTRSDIAAYLNFIEAIANGYSAMLDKELLSVVLIGLTYKAKSAGALAKHYNKVVTDLESRASLYEKRIGMRSKELGAVTERLGKAESSRLLRFFFGKRIARLRKVVHARSDRIRKLEAKRDHYKGVAGKLKATPRLVKL